MSSRTVHPAPKLAGRLRLPGDKSVGHRALMLGALSAGVTEIENLPDGTDNHSTRALLQALGVELEQPEPAVMCVHGRGGTGLVAPSTPLDCGNSGTTMRLMAGLLAGQGIAASLVGDESLSRRPMGRIVRPLRAMGFEAVAEGEGGRPPLRVGPAKTAPSEFEYDSPVASAQVKSCVLLAGLRAEGDIVVREPAPSRDHTERMLRYLGYRVESSGNTQRPDGRPSYVRLFSDDPRRVPAARPIHVPGDLSSAAFLLVAAALTGSPKLVLEAVSINPTRTGVLDVLRQMGVEVTVSNRRILAGNEPVADLAVVPPNGGLRAIRIEGALVPRAIDELPVLAVLATAGEGETVIADAGELRLKESDRIGATARLLRAVGADVEETQDGLRVRGPTALRGFEFDAEGDHRLAMAAAVAALVADGPSIIEGADACAISYPGFFDDLAAVSGAP